MLYNYYKNIFGKFFSIGIPGKAVDIMKKVIIPIVAAAVAVIAAVGIILFSSNRASADKPAPPKEIPSGNYYIDGDPENDELYLVVDGGTIHFESSIGLREAFKAITIKLHEEASDEDWLERQINQDMEDWGEDSYTYTVKNIPGRTNELGVMFRIAESEFGYSGQGVHYFPDTKTIHSWAGDYLLAE